MDPQEDGKSARTTLLAEYAQLKKAFPELVKADSRSIAEKYVWEHREDIEKVYSRVLQYFGLCGESAEAYKALSKAVKESVAKMWIVALQYSISSGDDANSRTVLIEFLFRIASNDISDSLLGLNEVIRECIAMNLKEEMAKETLNNQSSELAYQLYLLLGILIAAATRDNNELDNMELQTILNLLISQLHEVTTSQKLSTFFNTTLNGKCFVGDGFEGFGKVMPRTSLLVKSPAFSLKHMVLYYVTKILKLLHKNVIDPVKVLSTLKKALKDKKDIAIIMKAVRLALSSFDNSKEIPILELAELAFAQCPREEHAALVKEFFKLMNSAPELRPEFLKVLHRLPWDFSEFAQKALSRCRTILKTLDGLE